MITSIIRKNPKNGLPWIGKDRETGEPILINKFSKHHPKVGEYWRGWLETKSGCQIFHPYSQEKTPKLLKSFMKKKK